ncbi:MAG: hypothetical protein FWD03_03885 [Defluviitaleaceae bacterium]|nr:hypothetical protein [Defluviitaleaceae bacterium]
MASALSYEYLKSVQGAPNGIPTLDGNGEIPSTQLPDSAVSPFKGQFADEAALTTAYPTANIADFAYVDDTNSFWYWNAGLDTPAWVNQEIAETDYIALTIAEQSMVPYLVTPDPVPTP